MYHQKDIYKTLQKHLDRMPVGYPAARSGVELRILKNLFTPDEAWLATFLTHRFEPAGTICKSAEPFGFCSDTCTGMLDSMAGKGAILKKEGGRVARYALVPFVIGMFEFQVNHLTPAFYKDTAQYFQEAYGLEYLSTPRPQMRVIPIEQSITDDAQVATYDEIRQIIEQTDGKIGVAECICRKGMDLIGQPCRKTDRREVCLGFRDYFDTYQREGWFREISKKEALENLAQSEQEGLVLQATNEQYPQAVCACCSCCCGILRTLQSIPNPGDFVAANYRCRADSDKCVGCGICVDRCPMGAISLSDKKAVIDPKRCIGCGVCVPACKPGALSLEKRKVPAIPPETTEDLYEAIKAEKSRWAKAKTALKILRHMHLKDIRALMGI
ncbi:MAG: 4Fe-4S binding protein [Desulfobacterales bacterium]|nr:4Fe-4S binding protein [Desulfobacterales bacterium]